MFCETTLREIDGNLVKALAEEWMLVTAGDERACNTMTASWGGFGEMWGSDIAVTVVRPSRHTFGFLNDNRLFSLSFFGGEQTFALKFCGANSGRDVDKIKACGLTPVYDRGTVYFEEAKTVLICEKLYVSAIDVSNFCDPAFGNELYKGGDAHHMFVGRVVSALTRVKPDAER